MDILFTYIDKVVKMIEKFIDELSKSSLFSDEVIISLIVLMIIILVAFLIFFSKRKKGTKSLLATSKIKNKAQDTPIQKKDDHKEFTLQFKKSVANLDLDLSDQKNTESNQLTASQKRELTLNLKALKELLDGEYINQYQFDLKEKELKAAYD
jgi:uncharacterized membrane protein